QAPARRRRPGVRQHARGPADRLVRPGAGPGGRCDRLAVAAGRLPVGSADRPARRRGRNSAALRRRRGRRCQPDAGALVLDRGAPRPGGEVRPGRPRDRRDVPVLTRTVEPGVIMADHDHQDAAPWRLRSTALLTALRGARDHIDRRYAEPRNRPTWPGWPAAPATTSPGPSGPPGTPTTAAPPTPSTRPAAWSSCRSRRTARTGSRRCSGTRSATGTALNQTNDLAGVAEEIGKHYRPGDSAD